MWKMVQCAVQGRSHSKTDTPCQDKTFALIKNGVNVIALADGAGSAKLSHFGAERITHFICSDFSENFDGYFVSEDGAFVKKILVSKMAAELEALSKELGCAVKELASTLLLAAVKENRFILSHIGDGVIGYLKDNDLKIASQPENGEFTNTTVFTTSEDILATMKLIKGNVGDIQGFVLMSDGTEASLYNKREKKLADVLKKIMGLCSVILPEKIEEQLLSSFESVLKQATTDDCSIVLMVNDKGAFPGYKNLSDGERSKLLGVSGSVSRKRLRRYDDILNTLEGGRTLKNTSKIIHLRPKFTKKHLDKLLQLNFIEKKGTRYHTILIMDGCPSQKP